MVGWLLVRRFPDAAAVTALLDAGADINAFDEERNTALHSATRCRPVQPDIIRLLLSHGAHLDVTNSHGQSAQQLLENGSTGCPLYTVVSPVRHTTLQCLAARAITASNISFEAFVPRRLHTFIRLH